MLELLVLGWSMRQSKPVVQVAAYILAKVRVGAVFAPSSRASRECLNDDLDSVKNVKDSGRRMDAFQRCT